VGWEVRDLAALAIFSGVKLTAKAIAALFKEWQEDYGAAKREDAHWYGSTTTEREAFQKILDGKAESPAEPEKGKDRGIEI
jgi:hypothetical protein